MRIGTWNMAGRGSARHGAFLEGLACDVLLLTEVPHRLDLEPGSLKRSGPMGEGARKDWAAVWAREPVSERVSTHAWSAVCRLDGLLLVSSILPWRSVGKHWKGPETDTTTRTVAALATIKPMLNSARGAVVFGGDFNHGLEGAERAGSNGGRNAIKGLLRDSGLQAPTASLPHRAAGLSSIDHIAIPTAWKVMSAKHHAAKDEQGWLSDHDAYVVDVVSLG